MDVVAEVFGRHTAGPLRPGVAAALARRTAARLEAGGYARCVRVAGAAWLVPTPAGLALGQDPGQDKPFEAWAPRAWKLDHVAAVARLRLVLADRYPEARWESERAIRRYWERVHRQAGLDTRTRYADGGLWFGDGRAVGIECELHVKHPGEYAEIVAATDPRWTAGVWWFTPAAEVALLRARLAEALAVGHEVHELPEGVAP
jgi:hypothetical protein